MADTLRWPLPTGSPVLETLHPVIARSRHVTTNAGKIVEHASWMAYEELPYPEFVAPFGIGDDADQAIDFGMVANSINFAFTNFDTGQVFQVEYRGRRWSDAEAMFACLRRAVDEGIPVLDGRYLAQVTPAELAEVFRGNIEIPLLRERSDVLNQVGRILAERYEGRFCNFIRSGEPLAFDGGRGLLERLVAEFPRFRDVSRYDGHEVKFFKLAQLSLWFLHATLHRGGFCLEDAAKLTAFADYIVPAALRVMGILEYSPKLEQAVQQGQRIERDSAEEVEIRAHTIYAVALLTEELNRRRPPERQVINAQVDARLWTHFHHTHWPHHRTPTIMY